MLVSGTSLAVFGVWLVLAWPGYVLVRRYQLLQPNAGCLAHLALGYIYSFVLLTPGSVVCYILKSPLWVFEVYTGLVLVGASYIAIASGMFRRPRVNWSYIGLIGTVILLVDLVLGARIGGHCFADAVFHISRVRMLWEHGFNNWEPFFYPHQFTRVYHTNIYHAILAAISDSLGLDTLDVWRSTLPWAGLIGACGVFYLAWSVFENHLGAWLSAIAHIVWVGAVPLLLYPNKIAPYWLVSMAIGAAVVVLKQPTVKNSVTLGAICLVVPQVHSLYSVFAGLILVPVLAVAAAWTWRTNRVKGEVLLLAVVMPLIAVPFLVVSKYVDNPTTQSANVANASIIPEVVQSDESLVNLPTDFTSPLIWTFWLLPLLVSGLVFSRYRRPVLSIGAITLTTCVILYFVPIRTTLMEALDFREWMLRRMGTVTFVIFEGIAPSTLVAMLGLLSSRWSIQLVLCCGCIYMGTYGGNLETRTLPPWNWHRRLEKATLPLSELNAWADASRKQRQLLAKHIPSGSVVLASAKIAPQFVALSDIYVIYSTNTSPRIPGKSQRKTDYKTLWAKEGKWNERVRLLKKYGARHVLFKGRYDKAQQELYAPYAKNDVSEAGIRILTIY
jgi:hypothetical protein